MAKSNITINQYACSLSPEIREWLAKIDKLMLDNGCRTASGVVSNSKRNDGKFTYTSKKSKKTVCIINIGTSGCFISLRANHFIHPNGTCAGNILDKLPENIFNFVIKGAGCPPALTSCILPDYNVNPNCKCCHGHAEVFEYNGHKSHRCPHFGWNFELNKLENYDIITEWIKNELVWRP